MLGGPRQRARIRKALDWRTPAALWQDARWRLAPSCAEPTAGTLRDIGVRWPARYQHPNASPFVAALAAAFAQRSSLRQADIEQPFEGIVVFEIDVDGRSASVAIDYFDFTHLNEECASLVDVYFKMQHLRTGYGAQWENVYPGGYVTSSSWLYRNWCHLRDLHRRSQPSTVVFGRFGLRFAAEVRGRALEILSSDPRVNLKGGTRQTKFSSYLREMARAGVCIDLPGNGPFCYRLVEAMSMGCCIIGPPHATRLPVDLRSGFELVHCREDLSDLADLCARYTQDPTEARSVGDAAARYFDSHLHPLQLASYYVETIRTHLASSL